MQRWHEMKNKIIICFLLVSMLAASCTPATTPAPTATETATIVPTATSTPTVMPTPVTYLPGLSVNVPEPDAVLSNRWSMKLLERDGLIRDHWHFLLNTKTVKECCIWSCWMMLQVHRWITEAIGKVYLKFFGRQIGIVMGTDTA